MELRDLFVAAVALTLGGMMLYTAALNEGWCFQMKVARMIEDFMEGEMADIMTEVMKSPEIIKYLYPVAPARTITVEAQLPGGTEIYPYEKLSRMIEAEDTFAAATCYCRHHAFLTDKPCQVPGIPEASCLMFGPWADYIVDRGFGKRISREETGEILRAAERAGLVHNVGNYRDKAMFVCNCCGCCCQFLHTLKKHDNRAFLAFSNFRVALDAGTCSGCGDCIDRCQMEALRLENGTVSALLERCIGCGNCVSACSVGSLSMVRRSSQQPPESTGELVEFGM